MFKFISIRQVIKLLVVVISLLASISATTMLLPSLPTIANNFGVTDFTIKLSIPAYLFGSLLFTPIFGVFSDCYSKLFVMFLGIVLFFVGTLLCIFSSSIQIFLIARFIQGCGAIVSPVVGWAILQELYSENKITKIISWIGSILATASLIAPGIGGYIHTSFGWKGSFFLILFVNLSILILILFDVPLIFIIIKRNTISLRRVIESYKLILTNKKFLHYLFCYGFLTCGEWCYLSVIPFYFEKTLHIPPNVFGLYFSYSFLYYFFGTFLTPMLLDRFEAVKIIYIGTFLSLTGAVLFFGTTIFIPTCPLLISTTVGIYFLGIAIIWGPSTSKALQCIENTRRGTASAIRSLLVTGASAFGGIVGSFLSNTSLIYTSIFLLAMAFGSKLAFKKGSYG